MTRRINPIEQWRAMIEERLLQDLQQGYVSSREVSKIRDEADYIKNIAPFTKQPMIFDIRKSANYSKFSKSTISDSVKDGISFSKYNPSIIKDNNKVQIKISKQ